ncbi:putative Secretory carrier-associated membrane protein [Naja naja]|nr:putative Secretory carrier-associated membrane protein [Naja naja]
MSAFDANPFADPVDVNPFQDPSVTQLANANQGNLDEFNPFSDKSRQVIFPLLALPHLSNLFRGRVNSVAGASRSGPSRELRTSLVGVLQLLLRQASKYLTPKFISASSESSERQKLLEDSSGQTRRQSVASAAQAGLLKQQEDKTEQLASAPKVLPHQALLLSRLLCGDPSGLSAHLQNDVLPVDQSFFADFSLSLVLTWPVHSVTLLLNFLACLAAFTVRPAAGSNFGMSILWLILFTPCAFLCWYRPVYKAFR